MNHPKRLLQINVSLNTGSTGHIAENIARIAMADGWECYLIHGSRYKNPPSCMNTYQPGSILDEYLHYAEHYFLDNDGLASQHATRKLTDKIKKISPDIIQIHNLHDHWLNYKILFEYLNTLDIPVVWTQHDCWAFTGGCVYYNISGCNRWRDGSCGKSCIIKRTPIFRHVLERTRHHFQLKRTLFNNTKNLVLISVSHWLENELRQSFMKDRQVITIHNGIDLNIFQPYHGTDICAKYGLRHQKYVIGVASKWEPRKGLNDYYRLAPLLAEIGIDTILVGLNSGQARTAARNGITTVPRLENVHELVALYSKAEAVMNLSYEETFGLTTVEGMACGTPAVVYDCTASPELVSPETGIIVPPGNILQVKNAVETIIRNGKNYYTAACRDNAVQCYDKDKCYKEYINLYDKLLSENALHD